MPGLSGKKRQKQNRVRRRKLAAMSCAVLLCAAVFVMNIAARVYLTVLSDETAGLNTLISELKTEHRNALARASAEGAPYEAAQAAEEQGMMSPSCAEVIFLRSPEEDFTVYYSAYQTIQDKQKNIWEYFG